MDDQPNSPRRRRPDGPRLFAEVSLVAAATALTGMAAYIVTTDPATGSTSAEVAAATGEPAVDLDDGAVADPNPDLDAVLSSAATTMGEVRSVEFVLRRSGAPVFIDEFQSLALDSVLGQFSVPAQAQAQLAITIDDGVSTTIGAVALDSEVWISNPVTGTFEPLPPGFDLDPSRLFDPRGAWEPLIANLRDPRLVGVDNRGGERYRISATAPAQEIAAITVGLVDGEDVEVDLWVHPGTFHVTHLEFTTPLAAGDARWEVELRRFGQRFTIEAPDTAVVDGSSPDTEP